MSAILYEPKSIRSDGGILYLTETESCRIPFIFSIYTKDMNGEELIVNLDFADIVEFTIKENVCSPQQILVKQVTNISENVVTLDLTEADMLLLQGNKKYVLTAKLISKSGESRVLIKKLPMFIQEVV